MTSNFLYLRNDRIELCLDAHTGRVRSLRNRAAGLDLLAAVHDTPPWRIEIEGEANWFDRFTTCACHVPGTGDSVEIRWETDRGLTVRSRITLPSHGDAIFFTIAVENDSQLAVDKIEYPILTGVGPLVADGAACLTHSQGTGFLFRDPIRTFMPEPGPKQGLRYAPYPEGFNGATMQFMAYHAKGRGGFYFATRDQAKAMKWLNFYKDVETHTLVASFMHQSEHVAPGLYFAPAYPVEIACLYQGDWYEAAERYKQWAVHQEWTRQGVVRNRQDRPGWLLDDVALVTFGVNAAHDRAAWLDIFHHAAGRPLLHILGPNWARAGQDYHNHLPGGQLDDWLPGVFSKANLDTIRRNGDYWVPFEFDLLCAHNGASDAPVLESRQVLPAKKYSFDRYVFPFMCPGSAFWRRFHVERDAALVRDHAPDGVYYDISVNNVLMACRSRGHQHPPGGGQAVADAFASLFEETKAAMVEVAQKAVPIGTEMITELMIPYVDFYQARAESNPLGPFEADFFRAWVLSGQAEKIPLFAYVYHEYGPVRMDGWAKLSRETGDAFFWVASRVLLWGGLFELNYEFTGLEVLEGQKDDPNQHYYNFTPRPYIMDPEKLNYIGAIAEARAGWGHSYLAYGAMMRPPEIEVPLVELDYFFYNAGKDFHSFEDRGTIRVPAVVCAAWRVEEDRAAVFFANVTRDEQTVTVRLNATALGLPPSAVMQRLGMAGSQALGTMDGEKTLTITLAPLEIAAVALSGEKE